MNARRLKHLAKSLEKGESIREECGILRHELDEVVDQTKIYPISSYCTYPADLRETKVHVA